MALYNITQLRRVVFRKSTGEGTFSVFTLEPDDLGQDTVGSANIAPRKRTRASAMGSTEQPIAGTFNQFSGSITFLMDTFKNIGLALDRWKAATWTGAGDNEGQVIFGDGTDFCDGDEYMSVVLQGVCDDGSSADIEFTRCIPSIDDDIEFSMSETATITLNLNPIIYNAKLHAGDGYEAYSFRLGAHSTTANERLDVLTGTYGKPASE